MGKERFYSTGRGGAGNIVHGRPEQSDEPHEVPELSQKVFTTGRGGAGNMASNDDPRVARQMQDVDSPTLAPISSPTIGRGGYGNVRAGQEASQGLFAKAKGLFKPKKEDTSPAQESSKP